MSQLYVLVKWAYVVSSTLLVGMGAGIAFFFVRADCDGTALAPEYLRCYRWWFGLGWPAFTGVLVVFYLMVAKPALWGQ